MLGGVLIGVLTGFPLAYVVGTVALVVGLSVWGGQVGQMFYLRTYKLMLNYTILAVPLFVFMGVMLERSGIIERLYDTLHVWLGGFRGGLAVVSIIVGTIMAATVGIITASVTLLTLVALPSMIKKGYRKSFSAGVCVAGGCLGILIPPSIMIVIYGPMAEISVGKLFFGAFVPGFLLSALYITYIIVRSTIQKDIAPAVPMEERAVPFLKKTIDLTVALVPPGILIVSVLGVIFMGIAAPTEAAGVGAFAATLLTIAYRRFSFGVLKDVTLMTAKLSGFILLVGSMSFAFTGIFLGAGGGQVVTDIIMATPGGRWGAFAAIMFLTFMLGMFIDWIGIVFIMVPIITPIGVALGFDTIWFAIMIMVNLQTSFMTPPFAMAIYICKGAADPALGVTVADIIRGVIPFVLLILIGLGLMVAFPQIITWLPSMMLR